MISCRFDAVIFDMDNTLHNLYAARFCAAEAVCAYKGDFSNLLFYILNRDTPDLIPQSLAAYLDECGFDDFDSCLWFYERVEAACMRPYSVFQELIPALKEAGVKVAILSNADAKTTAERIHALGLSGIFDAVVNPETFGVKKPNPLVYQKTLELLGVTADRAVMIGDKLDRDVLPARDAGLSAIHVWFGSLDMKDTVMCAETQNDVLGFLREEK